MWATRGLYLPKPCPGINTQVLQRRTTRGPGETHACCIPAVKVTATFDSWQQDPSGPAVREAEGLARLLPLGGHCPPESRSIYQSHRRRLSASLSCGDSPEPVHFLSSDKGGTHRGGCLQAVTYSDLRAAWLLWKNGPSSNASTSFW